MGQGQELTPEMEEFLKMAEEMGLEVSVDGDVEPDMDGVKGEPELSPAELAAYNKFLNAFNVFTESLVNQESADFFPAHWSALGDDPLKLQAPDYHKVGFGDTMIALAYLSNQDKDTPELVKGAYETLYRCFYGEMTSTANGQLSFVDQTPSEHVDTHLRGLQKGFKRAEDQGRELRSRIDVPNFVKILMKVETAIPDSLQPPADQWVRLLESIVNLYPQDQRAYPLHILQRIKDNIKTDMAAFKEQREADFADFDKRMDMMLAEVPTMKAMLADYREKKIHMSEGAIKRVESAFESATQQGGEKYEDLIRSILDLPWGVESEIPSDFKQVVSILQNSHYGMDKAKEAIVDHVAVEVYNGKPSGKVLCLDGPPGVGKTSLSKSIGAATGREFVEVSLGGQTDSHAIHGHGFTYQAAQMGGIMDALRRAKTANPVVLLDELDKASTQVWDALLPVLDPSQNQTYQDKFLGFDYDLSGITFVCTVNDISKLPPHLRDRMEVVQLEGYTHAEKLHIARNYTLPSQLKKKGLSPEQLVLTDEALDVIVREYTLEAGVRGLDKKLSKLCAKADRYFLENGNDAGPFVITKEKAEEILGPDAKVRRNMVPGKGEVGVMNGLYYSSVGGGILSMTTTCYPIVRGSSNDNKALSEKFNVVVRGEEVGGTLKASIEVAVDYIRSHLDVLGINPEDLNNKQIAFDFHDMGGMDGPSAGGVITTMIISNLTGRTIKPDVAMTGTIGHGGKIGAIGGLLQKLDGAVMAGAKTVIISKENEADLVNVPESIKEKLDIRVVSNILEALDAAFEGGFKPQQASVSKPSVYSYC